MEEHWHQAIGSLMGYKIFRYCAVQQQLDVSSVFNFSRQTSVLKSTALGTSPTSSSIYSPNYVEPYIEKIELYLLLTFLSTRTM